MPKLVSVILRKSRVAEGRERSGNHVNVTGHASLAEKEKIPFRRDSLGRAH